MKVDKAFKSYYKGKVRFPLSNFNQKIYELLGILGYLTFHTNYNFFRYVELTVL